MILISCMIYVLQVEKIIPPDKILSITIIIACVLSVSELIFIKLYDEDVSIRQQEHKPPDLRTVTIGSLKLLSMVSACIVTSVLLVVSIVLCQFLIAIQPIVSILILLFCIFVAFVIANKKMVISIYGEK